MIHLPVTANHKMTSRLTKPCFAKQVQLLRCKQRAAIQSRVIHKTFLGHRGVMRRV
jgi:hypothetical protein